MTAKITVSNGNTTIAFSQTAPSARMLAVLDAAAHGIWNAGADIQGNYTDLTNQQKADLIDNYLKDAIVNAARVYNKSVAVKAAVNASDADAAINLTL